MPIKRRLIAFTTILLLSWTVSLGQDTIIEIPYRVAQEIAADLIRYDSALFELQACDLRLDHLEGIIATKDEIIGLYARNADEWENIERTYIQDLNAEHKARKRAEMQRNILGAITTIVIILALL